MIGPISLGDNVHIESLALRSRHRFDVAVDGDPHVPRVPVEVLVGQARRPCLGLAAGVHGDEYEGVLALQEIVRELEPERLSGTLLVIPVANPFAFAAAQRRTPEDNLDLNRVFPGKPEGSLTERLAALLCQKLLLQADAVFTLHGASSNGVLSPWVEFLDLPTPAGRASYELARASGFSDLIALPVLPGVLLAAMGELGVPLIEGEVGGRGTTQRENVAFCKERVYAIARHVGVLTRHTTTQGYGRAPGQEHTAGEQTTQCIWHLSAVAAEADGLFLRQVSLKQVVHTGERLGIILNMHGDVAAEVRAPQDGAIGGYLEHLGVRAGQHILTLWTPATGIHSSCPQPRVF